MLIIYGRKYLIVTLISVALLFMVSCQRTVKPDDNNRYQQGISNSLQTSNSNVDEDDWLVPVLSRYLQDDSDSARLTLNIGTTSISETAGLTNVLVTRTGDLSNGLVVALSSSDTSELQILNSVNFAPGQNQVNVIATIIDDCVADGNQTVSISASATGYPNSSIAIVVTDSFSSANALGLSFASATVSEAAGTTLVTVSHNGPTCAAVSVNLSSSDTSELTVPAIVTIPANNNQVTVNANVIDDPFDDDDQLVTITAIASSFNQVSNSISVLDDDTAASGTQVGYFSGHLSVVTSNSSTSDHIYVSIVPFNGVNHLQIDDQQGNPVQIFGSNLSYAFGGSSAAIIPLSLVNKLSIDTKPLTTTNDLVVMRDSLTLSQGLEIKTKNTSFFPTSGSKAISVGSSDIYVDSIEKIVLNNTSLVASSGDITLYANINNVGTEDIFDDTCFNFNGAFRGIETNAANIVSDSGSIKLSACGGTVGDYNAGMSIANSSTVKSTSGEILLRGLGGQSTGRENTGIQIFKAKVQSDGSAIIKLDGKGGSGTIGNFGVHLTADGLAAGGVYGSSGIYSLNGPIDVIGVAGTNVTEMSNVGVRLQGASEIKSTGSAAINVKGTGGSGTCPTTSAECSFNGIDVIFDSQIFSEGSGAINLEGQGGTANGREHHGMIISPVTAIGGTSAKVVSANGDITITATGGTEPTNAFVGSSGIYLIDGGSIEASNNANITVMGNAGIGGASESNGIFFEGTSGGLKSKITSVNGDINLTGKGNNAIVGNLSGGIIMILGEIESTGLGNIVMTGTGGSGVSAIHGIQLHNVSKVSTTSGNISLTGTAGQGTGAANVGVSIVNESSLNSNSGSITLTGRGSTQGKENNYGVELQNNGAGCCFAAAKIQTTTGAINIVGFGGGAGTNDGNIGILLGNISSAISGGGNVTSNSGVITTDGTGGNGVSANLGVYVPGMVSSNGAITVKGTGSTTASGTFNLGVSIATGGSVIQSGVSGTAVNSGVNNTNGIVTF